MFNFMNIFTGANEFQIEEGKHMGNVTYHIVNTFCVLSNYALLYLHFVLDLSKHTFLVL